MRFNSIVQDMAATPTKLLVEMDAPSPDRSIRQRAGRLYSEIDGTLGQRSNGPSKDLLVNSQGDALNAQSFEDGGGGSGVVKKVSTITPSRFRRLGSFQN